MVILLLACAGAPTKDTVPPAGDSARVDSDSGRDSAADSDTAPPDADLDGYAPPEDCDDGDDRVHPGAEDPCDAVDQDCDGEAVPAASCAETVDLDAPGFAIPFTDDSRW